jgi:diguanylate cyclase
MKTRKKINRIMFIFDDWIELKKNPYIMILILSLLPLIYFFVYSTGGIKYVYSHTMYIPIILAGIFYGPSFGIIIAFIAGILLGPLMPIDTVTDELQDTLNWLYRLFIFLIIGGLIGYTSNKLRREAAHIKTLLSVNPETRVPNANYLKSLCPKLNNSVYSIFTILISNHNNIIDILGTDIYHLLIKQIYDDLTIKLPKDSITIQSDSNKLWVIIPSSQLEMEAKSLVEILNMSREIKDIALYVNFSIGGSIHYDITNCVDFSIFEESTNSARRAELSNLIYILGDKDKNAKRSEYELLATFEDALKNGQTYLVYQPKIDLSTNKPYGFEALLRWNHPTRGNIPPDVFIPLVEKTNLIHHLTDFVLTTALKKIKELTDLGHPIPISINVSGKNLYDPDFYDRSIKLIESLGSNYDLIEFELTESTLMQNPLDSKEVLQKFYSKGIKISLDDFGSGYSSLAYLTQFPINYIKLDRLFMSDVLIDKHMATIVESTILLSKNLGYKVVCEGIENMDVLNLIKNYNCDYAQGYYFAKPMSSDDVLDWYIKHTK